MLLLESFFFFSYGVAQKRTTFPYVSYPYDELDGIENREIEDNDVALVAKICHIVRKAFFVL